MKSESNNPITLAKWIWRAYLKTVLIPVILIELMFLGIFFGINMIMKQQLSDLVHTAADEQITKMVDLEATSIDDQLRNIQISTKTFADMMGKAIQTPAALCPEDASRLKYSPDGAYYTAADTGGAAVFYSGFVPVNEPQREKVARTLTMQGLMKDIYETNSLISSIYLNTYDSLNVIYPYLNVIEQYSPQIDLTTFNFYYEADAEHDPDRAANWTNIYLDPAGRGWMTSSIAPIYNGDVLEGVVGIDVAVSNMIERLLKLEIPADGYALLVGNDGTILAITDNGIQDWKLTEPPGYNDAAIKQDTFMPESFNLYKMPDMIEFAEELSTNLNGVSTMNIGNEDQRASWDTVNETGWKLVLVVPEKSITGTIDRVGSNVQKIGMFLTISMMVFFVIFFRSLVVRSKKMSQVLSQPLVELNDMTLRIGSGNYYQNIPKFGVKELQETTENVVSMGNHLGDIYKHLLLVQEELKEKESYLQTVISSIDDAIVELDENGVINNLFINKETYGATYLLPRFSSIDSMFVNEKAAKIMNKLQAVIESGEQEIFETEVETASGVRWVTARMSLISRAPVRVVVTARDVTMRKEMEDSILKAKDEAEAANRSKSQFLSNMSHELRTPLNAVLGFAQVLEMDASTPLTGLQKECVEEILTAGNHLLELINEVLDLARIEAGETRLSIEPVDISVVIAETMTIINPTAEKYGIKVDLRVGCCRHRYVKADKIKLKQVLINLLSNAIKYNKPNGKVDYFCEVDDGKVRFHVVDTGLGIPIDQIRAIFKPFYRLNNSKNVIEGTGVGLAVVKQLTELMDGIVHAESTEGKGSHFYIELPVADEMTLWSDKEDLTQKAVVGDLDCLVNRKILCIEDNQVNLRLIERMLELIPGTAFLSAQTAKLGIEMARGEKPDLILLDINLPDMDGYAVFEKLQDDEATKNIPVIAVSSNAMERDIGRAMRMGFFDYITKPIKADVFIERIKNVFTTEQN